MTPVTRETLFFFPFLALLFTAILSPTRTEARELRVCPDSPCPFTDLVTALEHSGPGDEINVNGVQTKGPLVIDHPLRLIGSGSPVIDGGGKGHVIHVRANGVTIEGFVIQGSGRSDIKEYAGIYAERVSDCTFRNNHLYNNTYGIYLSEVKSCNIEGNISVSDAKSEVMGGNGIHTWYSSNLHIFGNNLFGHRDGVYLEFSDHLTIEDNTATGSLRYGLHFMFSHDNLFRRNVFKNNQTGVAVMYSKRIRVEENRFEESRGEAAYGMLLKDINDSQFTGNRFAANTIGIHMDNCTRNTFIKNDFYKNGRAIHIPGNSEDNEFRENAIRSNFFDVSTGARSSHNSFRRNYWSAYEGFDLDRDGLGDRSHNPVSVFDYWVGRFPVLSVLLLSPVVEFLEISERVFPVITPTDLQDTEPLMKLPENFSEEGIP